jgi:2-C-methyl-D-erythritol 4-phosphate cytidylyltransferase
MKKASRPCSAKPSNPRTLGPSPRFGLVVAAGKGKRFGGPKQFALLGGRPALLYSVLTFEQSPLVSGYVVVANPGKVAYVQGLLGKYKVKKLVEVVPGGAERSDSVASGLKFLPEDGYVAIHDAARPFVTLAMLKQGFQACRRYGAATFGHPVTDTLKRVDGLGVIETVDRDSLISVQTPQFFHLNLLRRAYAEAQNEGTTATDDCALIERLGIKPRWLMGPRTNLKITNPEDLHLCEALL